MASNQEEEVKLFGIVGSPFVVRVEIALNLKGVQYKFVEEKKGEFSDALIKYNPVYKKVPVLVHNEKPISESLVILEYIDETWTPNSILPSDPYKRALARFWAKYIDENGWSIDYLIKKKPNDLLYYVTTYQNVGAVQKVAFTLDKKEREKYIEEMQASFQILENELKDKFFGGEEIGLVDITAAFIASWVPMIEEVIGLKLLTSEKFPKLYKWSQDFINHQVVKEKLPNRETQVTKFKALHESLVASK